MILPPSESFGRLGCIPRESGDDPELQRKVIKWMVYSPRERG